MGTAADDELIGAIPAAALHVRGGEVVAANELARRLLGPSEDVVASIHEGDREVIGQVAAAAEAAGAGTVGPVLVRLDPAPPHRFVEVTFELSRAPHVLELHTRAAAPYRVFHWFILQPA